jgi:long-chain acyl-CoA synthetase
VPAEIDASGVPTLVALLEASFSANRHRPAYVCMDKTLTFGAVDDLSRRLGGWLQSRGLARGARVAIMMPNVLQYPVALAAVLRAGFVAVNVNPLYTPRELEFQLKDSGAEAIVVLDNFAATLQQALAATAVQHIVVASLGDLLGPLKGAVVNFVVRHIKQLVPTYDLPGAVAFNDALAAGGDLTLEDPRLGPDDLAILQYTGGTTGVAKGAMLSHRNLVANTLQVEYWLNPVARRDPAPDSPTIVAALPLYHIFAINICYLIGLRIGGCCVLIPNPRDIPGLIKTLVRHKPNIFPAVNTLFLALLNHPDLGRVDWSGLKSAIGGGMAVQRAVAEAWYKATGCPICEGYGLSETSPVLTCNRGDIHEWSGTIGLPMPSTEISIRDEDGVEVALGLPGEICARGPQVMAGYWQRPDETAKVMTADGFFRTGDIGVFDDQGRVRIVDRKKDMIVVSGFKVFPNEVEDVVADYGGVLESAAVGVPDARSGEAVKLYAVRKNPDVTEDDILSFCATRLAGYKVPKSVEFRLELPKSNVGKILRRALRDGVASQQTG